MDSNQPLVTIYMPTYNRVELLKRAVDSVLNQTYKNIEVIIVDDCSPDTTIQYLEELTQKDSRVRYFQNEKNSGACVSRNKAILEAKGEFITGLDDDDEFTPERIEFFLSKWDDKYSFICDNFVNLIGSTKKSHYRYIFSYKIKLKDMLMSNLASNQIFTRTQRLIEINGFNESLKKYQDWDCWIRLIYKYGQAIRFNKKSYIMYHDEIIRVSNNLKHQEAYNILINENIDIYKSINHLLIDKYMLNKLSPSWKDLFKCTSLAELKKVIKRLLLSNLHFIKKIIKLI